jgi:predicted TPR repeat methyltransferase
MSYIKNTFTQFKDFTIGSVTIIKSILTQLSVANLKQLFKFEYKDLKAKLADIKGTNWNLAQYHLIAGNYNDAIMRLKILQRNNYRAVESKYFLGRIYLEKNKPLKAKAYLNEYLLTQDSNYRAEAEYCIAVINHSEISIIPHRIICNKRDRVALNLERADLDIGVLNRYYAIIQSLKVEIMPGAKILEVGCYIGVLGRLIKETFPGNIQYYIGSEVGEESAEIAESMYLNDTHVYDKVKLCDQISQLISDQEFYSIILVPDILAYYGDLSHLFIQISASLNVDGIAVILARVVKTNPDLAPSKDIEFLHPIEEFRYSYEYVIRSAISCGLQLKNSNDIGDGFELFVFKKN